MIKDIQETIDLVITCCLSATKELMKCKGKSILKTGGNVLKQDNRDHFNNDTVSKISASSKCSL